MLVRLTEYANKYWTGTTFMNPKRARYPKPNAACLSESGSEDLIGVTCGPEVDWVFEHLRKYQIHKDARDIRPDRQNTADNGPIPAVFRLLKKRLDVPHVTAAPKTRR